MPNSPTITSNGGGDTASLDRTQTWIPGAVRVPVITVQATDPEQIALLYTIAGGADASLFDIDQSTGALVFLAAPNYLSPTDNNHDNIYEVIVQVWDGTSDAGGNPRVDLQTLRVRITDGHTPSISSDGGGETAALQIAANGSTAVTTVIGTDPDPGQSVFYWINGGADASLFTIDYNTGVLSFIAPPDYFSPADAGGNNVYDVIVQAWDGTYDANAQYRLDTQALSIAVQDALHAPTIVSNGGGDLASIAVIADGSTAVTALAATDPEPDTIAYAIVGGLDASLFAIDPASGVLTFINAPDFANPADSNADNLYEVTVRAWDGTVDGYGFDRIDVQALRISVLDNVNHAPTITTDGGGPTAALEIDEGSYVATVVGASDIDPATTITYSITGGTDAGLFGIDSTTGALFFSFGAPDFNFPQDADHDNVYLVNVSASDGSLSDSQALSIHVNQGGQAASIQGTAGDDTISAISTPLGQRFLTTLGDLAHGGDGNDTFTSTPGSDLFYGEGGNDTFHDGDPYGGPADHDVFDGGAGDDTFSGQFFYTNTFDGGAGLDIMELQLWVPPTSLGGYTFVLQNSGTVTAGFDSLNYLNVEAVRLTGTERNDNLTGGNYADMLFGGLGNDILRGLDGDDSFVSVSDRPDSGNDTYDGGAGTDYAALYFDDVSQLSSVPALQIPTSGITFAFGPGDSEIDTAYGHKSLTSIERVFIWGTRFADSLTGGSGDDTIVAYGGADELTGGGGNDRLVGDDYFRPQGIVFTGSVANYSGSHTDYAISGVAYQTGTLRLVEATLHDTRGGSPDGTDTLRYIDLFRFADGLFTYNVTTSQWVQISANHPPAITSNGGGDTASIAIPENTTAVTTVVATDPDSGTTLVYSLAGGSDAANFSINSATGALAFIAAPNFEAPGDAGADNVYDVIVRASDGALFDDQAIAVTVTNANDAPVVAVPFTGALAAEDTAFSFAVPAGTFRDAEDATLTLSATQANGTPLPSWIAFDPATGTFSGTPPLNLSAIGFGFAVTATDSGGLSAASIFQLTIVPVNDAPVALDSAVSGNEDTVITGAVIVTDVDNGTRTFTLVTGPAHGTLAFSTVSGTYSYTPDANYNGPDSFTFMANDGLADSNVAAVALTVTPVNDAPVVAVPFTGALAAEDTAFSFAVPAGTFRDAEDATLTLSATQANGTPLPSWIAFDPATGTFSGTPPLNLSAIGFGFAVTATDSGGLSAASIFQLTIVPVNDAPVALDSAVSGNEDTVITGAVIVTDVDNGTRTFTLVTGPAHGTLAFSTVSGTYSYTPDANYNGPDSFTFMANDGLADSNVAAVALTVTPVNDAPVVAVPFTGALAAEDTAFSFAVPAGTFRDAEDATLTLSATQANGTPLPSWIAFDPATGTFSGTPPLNLSAIGFGFAVTATDSGGLSAASIFQLTIVPVNDAPVALDSAVSGNEDTVITGAVIVTDVDNGTRTFTLVTGPAHGTLAFSTVSGTYSYTPDANYNGPDSFTFMANDGLADSNVAAVALTVTPVNDAPVVAVPFTGALAAEDTAFSFAVPAGTFRDAEDATLTLSATQANGTPLPSWIAFDPATGTFSGTPPLNLSAIGFGFAVTATDSGGLSAASIFQLTIVPVNDAPVALDSAVSGNEDTVITGAVIVTDVDNGTRTFTLVTGPAHGTLAFSTVSGTYSYTPDANYNGPDSFTFMANDGLADSNVAAVALTVIPVNDAPVVAVPIADQSATQGAAFVFALPAGTFMDADNPTLALSTSALPSWLSFDAASGAFVGTPGAGDLGTVNVTVTASDSGGLQASDIFAITVGSSGGNVINGTDRANTIFGTGSADTINALRGNDTVRAGAGDDTVFGGFGNDVLYGDRGNDTLYGEQGNDELFGGAGNDFLLGGAGNDLLEGGAGDDLLNGGTGFDLLTGGSGADRFVFTDVLDSLVGSSRDRITDFDRNADHIDLSGIDANSTLTGDQAFAWIGASAFSGAAGQLHYTRGVLSGDINGDGIPDFEIRVQFSGGGTFDAGDLFL